MRINACSLCSSSAPQLFLQAPALDRLGGPLYTYFRCRACGFIFLDPAVEPVAAHYDESGYYSRRAPIFAAPIDWMMGLFNYLRLQIVEQVWRQPPGRLLDVGCGKGRFLVAARQAGWQSTGIEPTERSWRVAVETYGLEVLHELLRDDLFPPEHFEVVTMWHTLEHIPDPVAALRTVEHWLVPGGLAVVAVPNIASLQARLGGPLWFHLDPPRHLSHFTPRTGARLFSEAGFETPRAHFLYPELNEFGMLQTVLNRVGTSPNLIFNLLKRNRLGLPASRAALAGNLAGTLLFATVVGVPLLLLEWLSEAAGRGGTMVFAGFKPAESVGKEG
jgi:SAM-dependent methyltransferase